MKQLLIYLFIFLLAIPGFSQRVEKTSSLTLDATSLNHFEVEATSGFLKILGSADAKSIDVKAEIDIKGIKEDELDSVLELKLEQIENRGKLTVKLDYENKFWKQNREGKVDLTVTIPSSLKLEISDGSGDIYITNISGKIDINDGSGDITIKEIKDHVTISDGSGNIDAILIAGNMNINDGSGEIVLEKISDAVIINDGSGDIKLVAIGGNVSVSDGSGEINISEIEGNVTISDGSGGIQADNVTGNLIINGSGSGGTQFTNIGGNIVVN